MPNKNVLYVVIEEGLEGHVSVDRAYEDEDEAEEYATKNSNEIVSMRVYEIKLIIIRSGKKK